MGIMEKNTSMESYWDGYPQGEVLYFARLTDWEWHTLGDRRWLTGTVQGHPSTHIQDGDFVVTSNVRWAHGDTVQTRNTVYKLDAP